MTHDDEEILAVARAGFLDEARDMLGQFEQSLLVMEEDPQDAENLNAAFRAAHTIKGTAGLFGFDAVVHFTHEAETLLEQLRSGHLAVSEHVTALLLRSRDQMQALLDEVRTGVSDPAVAEVSERLGAELRQASHGSTCAPPEAAPPAQALAAAPAPSAQGVWQLSLRFGADALRNGLDPLAFLRYLASLGQIVQIHTLIDAIPALEALDPEACHLGFEIRFEGDASREQIEQVFEFCLDDCDVALLAPDASVEERQALLQRRCADDEALSHALTKIWEQLGWSLCPAQDTEDLLPEPPEPAAPVTPEAAPLAAAPSAPQAAKAAAPAVRRGNDDTRFIRVRADKLDRLIDLIGELVIASSGAQLVAQNESSPAFLEAALRISSLVEDARDGALGLRMVPVGETFSRFQRVVRDLGKQLGKEVELLITGGDTELDKSMVEVIADPLMHLVRNSMDHGLEPAEGRLAAGKPATGRLALNAFHEAGAIVIEVSDDGRGLDRDRILNKARERGLIDPQVELSDQDIYQLIFLPGFSTAEQVTNVSGRGVGMDVVKRNIESLRGQIRVFSEAGRGATMQIRLPLTLAMIDGFLTQVGGVCYVLPLDIVAECIDVPDDCGSHNQQVAGNFDLRGEVLPWLDVGRFHHHEPPAAGSRRSLVIVRDGPRRVGLVVDRLLGEHQTVLKPLSGIFRHLRAIAGSTILGSGEVALVLDVPALIAGAVTHAHSIPRRPTTADAT